MTLDPRARRALLLLGLLVLAAVGGPALHAVRSYRFGLNETDSLPHWAFLTNLKDRRPDRGELVAFVAPPNRFYPRGMPFVKRVVGMPGDVIERRGAEVFVAGRSIGLAKATSQDGSALRPGPVGLIPAGRYFVAAPHVNSFDSRYGEIGLVPQSAIVGVAEPIL